ncbi:MAG: glycerol-3-phosphate dehydrogenase subunit GlpB [Pseudomonadota bacterium]
MKYDCLIIGGGIAGLTCGIKCLSEGLSCLLVSAGMSALHFSSGSIDLYGHFPDGKVVHDPFEALPGFLAANPEHPYAKCGLETIAASLDFFREQVAREGRKLYSNERSNHFHVTMLGTLKPTFFSQESVFNDEIKAAFENKPRIAILNFEGYRDFFPPLAAAGLARQSMFRDAAITTGTVRLPPIDPPGKNPHEVRSIDIGRLFDRERDLFFLAEEIKRAAGRADVVGLPACIGLYRSGQVMSRLREMTGKLIYETPTLPPSILGMRLDEALKSRFTRLGGVFLAGDRVVGGMIADGRLDHVRTKNYGDLKLRAPHFVLAAGSFFSGGLISAVDRMREPVFGLQLEYEPNRSRWYSPRFFDPQSHPFLSFGVKTDSNFNPWDESGRLVENLFCVGAVLAGYDPVQEGSGGGTAVGAAFAVAERIAAAAGPKVRHD